MALKVTRLGTNEDGTPHFLYEEDDPTRSLVLTGPIQGTVVANGTEYNVSDVLISVKAEDAIAVSNAIGERHIAEGHPAFANEPFDFVHEPTTEV